MRSFIKQLIFISLAGVILTASALIIKGATPSGFLKIKPSLTAKVKMVKQENATTTNNNPVGWWKMDEGTGQYAYDVSGNGNTGTLGTSTVADGADPTWTTGKLGKGLSFDGVNDYVSATTSVSLINVNSITTSSWVKYAGSAPNTYVSMVYAFSRVFSYIGTPTSKLYIRFSNIGGVNYDKDTGYVMDTNWHFIVQVYDGSYIRCYVDGVQVYSFAATGSIGSPNTVTRIGGHSSTTYFNGLIDDVRIYNRVLSSSEVSQMYNSTKDGYLGKIKVSTGLVGYWKLDDNNALTSVIDYSGKGNTGTAYSGTATSTSVLSTSTAMIGRAMSFDGVDDYVSVSKQSSLHPSFTYSVSMYFLARDVTTLSYLLSQTLTGGDRCNIHLDSGILRVASWNGTAYNAASGAVVINTWYHLVMVHSPGVNKLYLNGILQTGTQSISSGFTSRLQIGGNFYNNNYYFNGLIDEVKIWNYARSGEQIKNDYVKTLAGFQ